MFILTRNRCSSSPSFSSSFIKYEILYGSFSIVLIYIRCIRAQRVHQLMKISWSETKPNTERKMDEQIPIFMIQIKPLVLVHISCFSVHSLCFLGFSFGNCIATWSLSFKSLVFLRSLIIISFNAALFLRPYNPTYTENEDEHRAKKVFGQL